MSSHHIVRDFQEPALLIADGEQCDRQIIDSLLEWSPVVVALDGAFEKLVYKGIKVDYWLGDFDSVDPEKIIKEVGQDHVKIINTPDQNKTDLEKGIEFLMSLNAEAINVIWATGRRLDHTLGNLSAFTKYSKNVKLAFHDNWSKSFFVNKQYSKWYQKGQILSLIPMPRVSGLCTKGLVYNLDKESLEWGIRVGNSNETVEDGIVDVSFDQGNLLLIETHFD